MTDFDALDFFRGNDLVADPYPYFDHLRGRCPVTRESHHNVMMVTGYDEAMSVLHDDRFSSCNSVTGPFPGFPVSLVGLGDTDISDLIEQYRHQLPMSDQLPCMDAPVHTDHRGLLLRLITPKRLRENEEFMWRLADRQIDEFISKGNCEFISEFASPFAMFVVADLLGVPQEDHEMFRDRMARPHNQAAVGGTKESMQHGPLEFLYEKFSEYVESRRANPADDVITGLATARFRDGSLPEVGDVCRIAANVFGAGQETTVRLLAYMMQVIAERPDLLARLRSEPDLVPNFIEEALRMESPIKGDFRLSRVKVEVGGVEIPAGTTVMVVGGAANRDPRVFENPDVFDIDRANARHHIAFGHGSHVCPGAPLARAEGQISLRRIIARMADIRISEQHHGPADARRYDYAPTYILRGHTNLHLEFTPS